MEFKKKTYAKFIFNTVVKFKSVISDPVLENIKILIILRKTHTKM